MVRTTWYQTDRSGHPAGLWTMMMAVLMAFLMCPPASIAAGNRVAFVVGIGTYDHLPPHQQLTNPLNDADGVSKKLTDIGFQVVKAPNLTRSDFNARWQDVLHGLDEEDTFVLYFSGHGVQVDGQNYLLPRDIPYIKYGRQAQLTREAISLDQLLSDLSTGNLPHPKRSVVILDACRDNPLVPQEFKGGVTRGGLAKLPEPNGIFVIYSAGSNKTALDRLSSSDPIQYSVFTRVLLPLMERTDLTIQTLSIEIREQVAKLTEDAQQPAYYDGIRGRFCLPGCIAKDSDPLMQALRPPVFPQEARSSWTPVLKDFFVISETGLYQQPDNTGVRLVTIQEGYKVYAESRSNGDEWLQIKFRGQNGYIPSAAATEGPPWEVLPWLEGDVRARDGRDFDGDDLTTVQEEAMQFALEYVRNDERVRWRSSPGLFASGMGGYFKVRSTEKKGGKYCRKLYETVHGEGGISHWACRNSQGKWEWWK